LSFILHAYPALEKHKIAAANSAFRHENFTILRGLRKTGKPALSRFRARFFAVKSPKVRLNDSFGFSHLYGCDTGQAV